MRLPGNFLNYSFIDDINRIKINLSMECSWPRKICHREGNFFRCMCIRIQHREIQDVGNS